MQHRGAWHLVLLWSLVIGTGSFSAPAAFVYESPAEFLTSGDFNGDGRTDALVLDKLTGNVRVGYQNTNGALAWSPPRSTGTEAVSALAVGRFAQTNSEAIAVTAANLNRIHILNLSNPSNAPTPAVINPPHAGTALLVGLDAPYGASAARSWLSAGTHDPGVMLIDLLAFVADSVSVFQDQIAAEGFLNSGNALAIGTNHLSTVAGLLRGSNDTFAAYSYAAQTNVLYRVGLEAGAEFTPGHFQWNQDAAAVPVVLFYVPGKSNLIVQRIITSGNGFALGAPQTSTYASAIQRVYFVDEGTNGFGVVQFGDGVAGVRPGGTNDQLQVSYGLGLGPAGNVISGVVPLGIGKFALLSSASNSLFSTSAQVFTLNGTNYTQTSSSSLPAVTSAATRGNVWLFQIEPFLSSAATLIGSLSAPAWSSTISGLPGTIAVRVESDGGTTTGLGSPATNSFGAPPAGTAYVLPNQYREDISFFGYAPARVPTPSVITISPPPGAYGGPIQISFAKQNATDDVYYRQRESDPWLTYVVPFPLTNDATIQYYGEAPGLGRGQTQAASYTLGNPIEDPATPVTLPGSDTNPPPVFNPNIPQISAGGTVFYSRHSALAESLGLQGPSPYLHFTNSPFNSAGFTYFQLENFEDGLFNPVGATASPSWIVTTAAGGADSVEPGGRSYYSSGQTNLTITFNAAALGGKLPTHAGVVWTDVGSVTSGAFGFGNVRFTARDANGVVIGVNVGGNLGNGSSVASQVEDRFFGIVHAGGISSISIAMTNSGDWEVDHLQFGHLDSAGFNDGIWAINLDGNAETFLTSGARPRASRDGRWMAFLREGGPVTGQGNLWVRELPTGQETRIFTNTDSIMACDWNGTQTEVIFDNACVLLRQAFVGPATQLPLALTPQCFNGAPVVNPADGRLAFHNVNPSGPQGVYVAPASWASRTKIIEPSTLRLRWPAWSPDGTRLAMADRISSAFINTGVNLWTAAADGSNLRQITALTEPDGFPRGAVWTSDGKSLVGAGRIGGTNGLWVIPLATDGSACHCPPRLVPTSAGSDIDFVGSVVAQGPSVGYTNLGLFIRLDPAVMVVYWSTNYDGFTLESAPEMPAGLTWSPVSGPYFRAGPYFEYREARTALSARKYFRLHYPGVLVLTPAEPQMEFRLEPNAAVLNWPLNYVGYTLEATTNLAPPILWTPLDGAYLNTNGVFEFRRPQPGPPAEYYRLRGP